eukprot:TRINITY_DN59553_c0_g1_i1.p1 TRINITY_DN59553_c0_g1~~TRINITY_DN59553_c0_g1_i1.p1  ORF type:complete len:329 (+),score=110.63 TRINITY_DN59553_c0_g1_i1:59-988(+)
MAPRTDAMLVKTVDDGSWASTNGLMQEDELLLVNGSDLRLMTKGQVKAAMRARPLELAFLRGAPWQKQEQARLEEERKAEEKRAQRAKAKAEKDKLMGRSQPDAVAHRTTAHFAQEVAAETIEVTADKTVVELGFAPSALPPAQVYIKHIEPNSWAEEQGLQIGDELEKLQGVFLFEYSKQEMKAALKERPLTIQLARDPATQRPSFLLRLADQPDVPEEESGAKNVELFAYPGDGDLGLKLDGTPPGETVRVRKVVPQSIAFMNEVKKGDKLVEVNGKVISRYNASKLQKALEKRPVKLIFERSHRKK